jgi:hypothetical protein
MLHATLYNKCSYLRFDVFSAVKMSKLVFWVVASWDLVGFGGTYCLHLHFTPENRGSKFLRNVGINLQVHTTFQHRRLTSALTMEAVSTSETLVNFSHTIWRKNREDSHLQREISRCPSRLCWDKLPIPLANISPRGNYIDSTIT